MCNAGFARVVFCSLFSDGGDLSKITVIHGLPGDLPYTSLHSAAGLRGLSGTSTARPRRKRSNFCHAVVAQALRVVYEIHLIGGRERETAALGFALDDVLRDGNQRDGRLAVGHDRIDGLLVQPFRLGPRAVEAHELRVGRLVRV